MSNNKPTQQQQAIINAIKTNVAVAAGAGSGKTQVLVGRFMNILTNSLVQGIQKDGKYAVNVDQLVAITFTKKAAAEMRSRLRERLNDRLQELEEAYGNKAIDKTTHTKYSSFWREQLQRLPRTHISTIHSLCSFLLRENPLEAKLDPQFKVAEELQGEVFLQNCLEQFVRKELKNKNEHVEALLSVYGFNRFLEQMHILLPQLPDIERAGDLLQSYKVSNASMQEDKEELIELLRDFIDNRDGYQKPATAQYKQALDNIAKNYEVIAADISQTPSDFSSMWEAFGSIRAQSDFKESYGRVKELAALIAKKSLDALALPIIEHWQALLQDLNVYVKEEKLAQDLLSFDDLETMAIELLQQNAEVRKRYHERFAHIMVDEFQDTNDRQRQLIYLLCGNDAEKLSGKKLFVVGDPKQSIYRFRGADVSVFKRVQEEILQHKGKCLSMDKNFRSRENILKAVNAIFEPLMGINTAQDVYFSPLEADIPRMEDGPAVEYCVYRYSKEVKEQTYIREAELVAAKILQLQQEGRNLGDITILMRSMTRSSELLSVFKKYKIPFVLHSGKGFYEAQEVLDLINLLRVLTNKARSLELAGILRSPYFGIHDESLTKLFLEADGKCLWDALMEAELATYAEEQKELLLRARSVLQELRQSACTCGIVELWQELWQKLSISAVLSLQEQGEAKFANVKKLQNLAYSFVQEQQGTLAAWVDYLSQLRDFGSKETAATVDAEAAVQIMTYHSSKGLEFPVVILPFLEENEQADKDSVVFVAPNKLHPESPWGLGVKVLVDYDLQDTHVMEELRKENRRLAFEERKRLLYVATTRAEQQLVLFASGEEGKVYAEAEWEQKNWFVQLESLLDENSPIVRTDVGQLWQYLVPMQKQSELTEAEATNMLQPLPTYNELATNYFSPSALQTYAHCQRCYFYNYGLGLPKYTELTVINGSSGLSPTELGHIVHKSLELYTCKEYNEDELKRCFKLALEEYVDGETQGTKPAWDMLYSYLHSDMKPNLPEAKKELDFSYYVDNIQIAGSIDCLTPNEDGSWSIIDYKTGRFPNREEGKNAGYMYQLALYRLAVETLYGYKIKKSELHYLQALEAVGLEDEAEYKHYLAEALNYCKEIAAKERAESAFKCNAGAQCPYCEYSYVCSKI